MPIGGGNREEVTTRIAKAKAAFANIRHLKRRHDIRLALNGRACNASVRSVLVYRYEAWPLWVEETRQLFLLERRRLRRITLVWWRHRVKNDHMSCSVLVADNRALTEIIAVLCLRWLEHLLRLSDHSPLFCTLFARLGQGWQEQLGGQAVTWCRGRRKLT